jgi:UDP-glucose 4-epimerase
VPRLVAASSSSVYGDAPDYPTTEESITRPVSPYGVTKLASEHLSLAYARPGVSDISVATLRYFTVYGPRQRPDMAFRRFLAAAYAGEPITVYGDGTQTRCFAHVADVVDALLRLLDTEAAVGQTFNVGSSEEISIGRLAERIITHCQASAPIRLVSYDEVYGPGFEDMRRRVPDTTKLRALTGWAPSRSLDDILTDAIDQARRELCAAEPDLVAP